MSKRRKSYAEGQRRYREKRKREGIKDVRLSAHEADVPRLRALAKELLDARRRALRADGTDA